MSNLSENKRKIVLTAGDLIVDMVSDEMIGLSEASMFNKCFGGAPGNFAVGISYLGHKSRIISTVGDDFFGDFLLDYLKKFNIDTDYVFRVADRTTLAFTSGTGDFVFYRGSDMGLSPRHVIESAFEGVSWFHFSGFTLSSPAPRLALKKCLRIAKDKDIPISISVNYREDVWPVKKALKVYKNYLKKSDYIIASQSELEIITGERNLEKSAELASGLYNSDVIVTLGEKGSAVYDRDKKKLHYIKAYKTDVIDTTGAGDGFCAGFVSEYLNSGDIIKAAISGNKNGSLICSGKGATGAYE